MLEQRFAQTVADATLDSGNLPASISLATN
jgi:hypothetical protein